MRHDYTLKVVWTGNLGDGTGSYRGYARDHVISAPGKPDLHGSADPAYQGDVSRWNPEELLLASLSACHQLWFLHLCAEAGVVVRDYVDEPLGEMQTDSSGSGQFTKVTLRPRVGIENTSMQTQLSDLHSQAHKLCFIARSVNFPVVVEVAD